MKNWLSAEKCKRFLWHLGFTQKVLESRWKSSACSSKVYSIPPAWMIISKRNKAFAETSFVVSFVLRAEKNLISDDTFSALLSKLHSESVELFCDSFSTNNIVYLFRDLSKILLEFWREVFGNFVKTAFYITADQFEEKPTCRKNIVFHILWHLERKFFWLGTTLVLHCWHGCAFFTSTAQFWYFFPTMSIFLIKFDIWEWISYMFSSKIFGKVVKNMFQLYRQCLMKNWLSAEKCKSFFITFGLYTKMCWTLAGRIQHNRQRCNLLVWSIILKRNKAFAETSFVVSFVLGAEKNLIFDDNFSALLSKLHSESVELFCDLLWTNSFVSFSRSEQDFVGVLEWNFWQFCQNCILLLKHQFDEKPTYRKRKVFHILWVLERKLFWLGTTLVLHCWHGCAFFTSTAQFWYFFPTMSIFLIKFVIWEWISYMFSSKIFGKVVKNMFQLYRQCLMKNWLSSEKCKSFFITFGLYTKMCWTLAGRIQHNRQRCNLLVWSIILKRNKAFAETSFVVSFVLGAEKNLIFDDNFSALLSKLHSESVELFCDLLWTNSFVSFSRSEQDFVGVLEWNFCQFCQNCFLYHSGSIWRETNLSKKHSVSHPLALGEEIILTRDNLGSALLTWLRFFYFYSTILILFSNNVNFSHQIRYLRMNFLHVQLKNFWQSCQKYVSTVQTMFDEKLVVRWKV